MYKFTALISLLLLPLITNAVPGDLCSAVKEKPIQLAKVRQAVAAGESANTMCGKVSAFVLAVDQSEANSAPALFLIDQGADVNQISQVRTSACMNCIHDFSNFTYAARKAPVEVVRSLLPKVTNLDFIPTHGQGTTALGYAIYSGKAEKIDALIDAGANKYLVKYNYNSEVMGGKVYDINYTALELAVEQNLASSIVSKLLKAWDFKKDGHDLTDYYLLTALGSRTRTLELIRRLVDEGADLKSISENRIGTATRYSAMLYTSQPSLSPSEDKAIWEFLFANGLDINEIKANEAQLVMNNVFSNYDTSKGVGEWLALTLLDSGANAKSTVGSFPLLNWIVGPEYSPRVMDSLLAKGADINAQDSYNKISSPLIMAIVKRGDAAAIQLIEKGADVNLPSVDYNYSPLCYARIYNRQSVIDALLKKNAHLGACTIAP